jgi:NitT/TauT family transport system ATP-binding protein
MSMLDIRIDHKVYPGANGTGETVVFRDFKLRAAANEFVCLFGPSGCGKTTLLNIVAGLDTGFQGQVGFSDATDRRQPRTGYVFQEPRLLPWRSVRDNIRLAVQKDPARLARIDELMATVGLTGLEKAYPRQLSAGQARRAALARAFATAPDLLLMDEPFVSLDDPAAELLHGVLLDVWSARPATVLFVTHNLREAMLLADRIVLLRGNPATIVADRPINVPRNARSGSAELRAMQDEFDALRRDQRGAHGVGPGEGRA